MGQLSNASGSLRAAPAGIVEENELMVEKKSMDVSESSLYDGDRATVSEVRGFGDYPLDLY